MVVQQAASSRSSRRGWPAVALTTRVKCADRKFCRSVKGNRPERWNSIRISLHLQYIFGNKPTLHLLPSLDYQVLSWITKVLLSYFIVSPNMHKTHHHYVLPYTDSNYGNIFSIWDRLLGTYMYLAPEKIIYGVDVFPDEKENNSIKTLLKQPFQPYKKPTTGRWDIFLWFLKSF